MKGKNLFVTAIIMLAVGLLLAIFATSVNSEMIVQICGGLFILAAVANISYFLGSRDKDGKSRMGAMGTAVGWVASAAAAVLGLCMLLFRGTFIHLVAAMFAILVAATAIFQLCLLLFGSRPARLSPWFFIIPVLLAGAAVYIFVQKPVDVAGEQRIIMITGVAFALFGLTSVIEGIAISAQNHSAAKEAAKTAEAEESKEPKTKHSEDAQHSGTAQE